ATKPLLKVNINSRIDTHLRCVVAMVNSLTPTPGKPTRKKSVGRRWFQARVRPVPSAWCDPRKPDRPAQASLPVASSLRGYRFSRNRFHPVKVVKVKLLPLSHCQRSADPPTRLCRRGG